MPSLPTWSGSGNRHTFHTWYLEWLDDPSGHSTRRISDFRVGLNRSWSEAQGWKRLAHGRNPVNDAMGNVEAFEEILRVAKDT